MSKHKVILVTGGSGFIGTSVIKLLLEAEYNTVVNFDKLTYAGSRLNLLEAEDLPNYYFELGDICDAANVERVLNKYQPSAIIHLAAESHVDRSIFSPSAFIQTNVLGTYVLLDKALMYWQSLSARNKRDWIFLHVSTDEVFGDLSENSSPFTEDTPYSPSSPYSATKASSDHLVRAWYRTYGLPALVTNCSNNYGPFQLPDKLIPLIINNALAGDKIPIYGNGNQIRDWLFVKDHAEALVSLIDAGQPGDDFNIGGTCELTNLQVVECIFNIMSEILPAERLGQSKYSELIQFVDDRPGHDFRYAIDSQKLSKDLGWQPKETFLTGAKKTVQWYLDNQNWCLKRLDEQKLGEMTE